MSESDEHIRTFVGVPLSEDCERAAEQLLARLRAPDGPLRGARVTCPRPGNLHLTLKFLGQTPQGNVPALADTLGAVPFEPFTVQLSGAGFFPPGGRPRVFWAGLTRGAEALAELSRRVNQALGPHGFAPDTRPFRPHLTLCRVRDPGSADWSAARQLAGEFGWPALSVDHFVFWRSVLGPAGPTYTPLGRVRAAGGPD